MSAADQLPAGYARLGILTAICLMSAIYFFAFGQMFNRSFQGRDDELYFYRSAVGMFNREDANQLEEQVKEYLTIQNQNGIALRRWNLQVRYKDNYLMMNASIYGASRTLRSFIAGVKMEYPLFLAISIAMGVIIDAIVAFGMLCCVVMAIDSLRTASAVALGLALLSALTLLQFPPLENFFGSPSWAILGNEASQSPIYYSWTLSSALASTWGLIKTVLIAGPEYSIFGYTPRSQVYLAALAIFLLRWNGFWVASYAVAVAIAFFHQSMAALVLIFLVSIDAVTRPYIFDRKIIFLCGFGIALHLARESLFSEFGLWPYLGIVIAVTALLGGAGYFAHRFLPKLYCHPIKRTLVDPFRKLPKWLGPIGSDLVVGLGFCLLLIPAAVIMNRVADPYSALVFWSWLPVRSFMIFQPALFVGLSIVLISFIERRFFISSRWLYGIIFGVAVLLTLPCAYRMVITAPQLGRAAYMISKVSSVAGWPLGRNIDVQAREAALDYAISFQIDTGQKILAPMLGN